MQRHKVKPQAAIRESWGRGGGLIAREESWTIKEKPQNPLPWAHKSTKRLIIQPESMQWAYIGHLLICV